MDEDYMDSLRDRQEETTSTNLLTEQLKLDTITNLAIKLHIEETKCSMLRSNCDAIRRQLSEQHARVSELTSEISNLQNILMNRDDQANTFRDVVVAVDRHVPYNTFKVTRNDDAIECSICTDELIPNERRIVTACNHSFHPDCLMQWTDLHDDCPICRMRFQEN